MSRSRPLLRCLLSALRPALEIILPAGHLLEPEVRAAQDVVKVRCLNIGFQIDLCLARKCSGGVLASTSIQVTSAPTLKRITLFDDLIMRAPIDRKPGVNALALFIKFLTPLYMQLRRELVQIGVRAGFQLLAQLPGLRRRVAVSVFREDFSFVCASVSACSSASARVSSTRFPARRKPCPCR